MFDLNIEIIGWFGTTAFAVSGIPQAIKSYREGHSDGISHGLIWLWLVGELMTLLYTGIKYFDVILLVNYSANLFFVGMIAWYKYLPRKLALSSSPVRTPDSHSGNGGFKSP